MPCKKKYAHLNGTVNVRRENSDSTESQLEAILNINSKKGHKSKNMEAKIKRCT